MAMAAAVILSATGCVSVAEFRKLEREVLQMRRGGGAPAARERVADLGVDLATVNARIDALEGRVEVAEHEASNALEEARRARQQVETASRVPAAADPGAGPPVADAGSQGDPDVPAGASAEEVEAYRLAHQAWSSGELDACIDRFRTFLQTHPASPYADDASYWMADCHFRQGDFKTAILRFDDVVARYPDGDKSADALYRQGEALLRLGPAYSKAAGKAFERVVDEYPSSPRAVEAKRQLQLLGSG
jgi:tol-pal system protein YbgF